MNVFFFFKNDSKNWTFFFNTTQRIEPSHTWLKELNLLCYMTQRITPFLHDSNNRTLFFNMTQRIELFYMTQRIEPFFLHDSKNWTFFLHNSTTWASSVKYDLRKYDSKNWHLFKYGLKNWTFSFTWLNELNPLFSLSQRIEPFFFCQEI